MAAIVRETISIRIAWCAVDIRTGKMIWYNQLVHHDIWDYDMPPQPILLDVMVDGRPVKGVFQVSKQAFAYAFDRVTGKPIWPLEERPVPQTDAKGEWTAATQPFPTKPPAFDWQGVNIEQSHRLHAGPSPTGDAGARRLQVRTHLHSAPRGGKWFQRFDPGSGLRRRRRIGRAARAIRNWVLCLSVRQRIPEPSS